MGLAGKPHGPPIGRHQPPHDAQQRAFAAAARPDQADDFPSLYLKADRQQRLKGAAVDKFLGDVVCHKDGWGHAASIRPAQTGW